MEFSGIGAEIAIFYPVKLQIILEEIRCIFLDCDHFKRYFFSDAKLSEYWKEQTVLSSHLLPAWEWKHQRQKCHSFWICFTVTFSLHVMVMWEIPPLTMVCSHAHTYSLCLSQDGYWLYTQLHPEKLLLWVGS